MKHAEDMCRKYMLKTYIDSRPIFSILTKLKDWDNIKYTLCYSDLFLYERITKESNAEMGKTYA